MQSELAEVNRGWRTHAQWKVPALFCNDWACLTIARALRERCGRDVLRTAYGAPGCAWAGGRAPLVTEPLEPDELRRRFGAYRQLGMEVSLTLSRSHVDESLLADPYCNTLLDLLEECDGSVIAWDDKLARHIRRTHPRLWIVASIARSNVEWAQGFPGCSDEADFYRRTLELYDEVVVRSETAWNDALLSELEPIADRCQVLVNQSCPPNCRLYAEHMALGEAALERGDDMPECMNPLRNQADMIYPDSLIEELVGRGFRRLKIRGRDLSPYGFARETLRIVAGDADPARILEPEVVTGLKIISLRSADPLMRTDLPRSAN